jgi:hypothetical protein
MNKSRILVVLGVGVLAVSSGAVGLALAETKPKGPQPPTEQTTPVETEAVTPTEPGKVKVLAEQAGVTPEQVNAMRSSGLGWGEIKIAISMAQKISTAKTTTPTTTQTTALPIGPILDSLLSQRQSGMGWGEIAQANGFKLGEIVGKGEAKHDATVAPVDATSGTGTRPERGSKVDKPEKIDRPEKLDKPERPERPEKLEKPEKPERPEKPEKPEHHTK